MNKNLNISFLQYNIIWEDPVANKKKIEIMVGSGKPDSSLLILPEMFTTGFTMNPGRLAESMDGDSVRWMREKAGDWDVVVAGSLVIREGSKIYNRFIWMTPTGEFSYYDKRHLFRMGEENHHYASGKQKLICRLSGWRIRPLICYDLRFPVWARNRNDYDILVYVANWPDSRRNVWSSLLIARALENQSYVVGVNRTGKDANGISYSGDSVIIDPRGKIISSTKGSGESFESVSLSMDKLIDFRKKFPAWMDGDDFTIL